jgi:hypothetical protein
MIPRDGKMYKKFRGTERVGVLVSYGYGAGWYSWNRQYRECLFAPEIVHMVSSYNNKKLHPNVVKEIEEMAERLWPEGYWGGAEGLCVIWLPVGTKFRIDEYDGAEGLETIDDIKWLEA